MAKGKTGTGQKRKNDDKATLQCSHCGGTRHTKEECFKLIGYPEWWSDPKKKEPRHQNDKGKAAMVQEAREVESSEEVVYQGKDGKRDSKKLKQGQRT